MNRKILIAVILLILVVAAIIVIFNYSPSSDDNRIKEVARQHLEKLEGSDISIITKNIVVSPDGTEATMESSVTWPDAPGTGIKYEITMKKISGEWVIESEKVLTIS